MKTIQSNISLKTQLEKLCETLLPAQISQAALLWVKVHAIGNDRVFTKVSELLDAQKNALLKVEIDNSPVYAALPHIHAQFVHKEQSIVLNGHVLSRSQDPEGFKQFLVLHEYFHFLTQQDKNILQQFSPLNEEDAADAFALLGLIKEREARS